MGPVRYLRDAVLSLSIAAVTLLLIWLILRVAGAGWAVALLVVGVGAVSVGVVAAIEYGRRREFTRDLIGYAADPNRVLWSTDLVDRPDYLEGQIAFDTLRMITKAANDRVADTNRRMQEYREYIETWVHEAKSPLAAAHLMLENLDAELSAADAELDPEAMRARVTGLADVLDRTEGYIEQALFYARSEAVDRDYLIRTHRLRELVTSSLRDNARLLISAHVSPVLGDGLDLAVFTDEKWLQFILSQVIQNGVKYARPEGASIRFEGRLVDEGTASERIELSVADNGRGVSAADVPRVFDKGFTGEIGREGKRSTGIGLYLVKRLCDKMGVEVEAASAEGAGFTVTFSFSTNKFHYFEGSGAAPSAGAHAGLWT
ncbi:MAG: HAMP domain-containing histidine kinase [Coriobacteriaceae bacterium]|nr:HAMP domain-containing histidine kinase [Coriobacteriaceae bacterium]